MKQLQEFTGKTIGSAFVDEIELNVLLFFTDKTQLKISAGGTEIVQLIVEGCGVSVIYD